jgi:hypothetical protein
MNGWISPAADFSIRTGRDVVVKPRRPPTSSDATIVNPLIEEQEIMRRPSSRYEFHGLRRMIARCIVPLIAWAGWALPATGELLPIPMVKQFAFEPGRLRIAAVSISAPQDELANEVAVLEQLLAQRHIVSKDDGTPIELKITDVQFPPNPSSYAERIAAQGYRIDVNARGVVLAARSPMGVYYAVQTLTQLITPDKSVQHVRILDWPDLAVRAVMVDPARANENLDYYQRMIAFCGRYKINRLHMHLTDDENACLYHEDYPSLMHPHAWRAEGIGRLVDHARRHHIDIVPEIESLGHARMFVRHPRYREILHQTTADKPAKSWAGTDVPGFTNVLCPASDLTLAYLDAMYARAAELFPFPETHIGYDEVDTTECARCDAKFGKLTHAEWLLRHLLRCHEFAARDGRRVGLWGDMLLNHRDIVERIPRAGTVIYDWHYNPNMTDESAGFFKQAGFEVMGCPALVCHPHMVMSSDYNYRNISKFAKIARQHDLLGLDTTIWTPVRYMSDVLWPGIAYAATQSWSSSNWDEINFYIGFLRDFHGSPDGARFARVWRDLYALRWWLDKFQVSCWHDADGLSRAREQAAGKWGAQARKQLTALREIKQALIEIGENVQRHRDAWAVLEQSVAIRIHVGEHFLASLKVQPEGQWDLALIRELDKTCVEQLQWIEASWDRDRFADDPYKDDLNRTGQHLLDHYRRMHAFHERILRGQ